MRRIAFDFFASLFCLAWLGFAGYFLYGLPATLRLLWASFQGGPPLLPGVFREVLRDEAHPAYRDVRRVSITRRGAGVCWIMGALFIGVAFLIQYLH